MWQLRTAVVAISARNLVDSGRHRPWGLTRHELRFHQRHLDRSGRDMEICPKAETPGGDQIAGVGPNHNRLATVCGKNLCPRSGGTRRLYISASYERYCRIFLTTAAPASAVLTAAPAAARSAVRTPSVITSATAFSTTCASSVSPREWRSSMAVLRMVPQGLAMPFPAISGAEPW